MPANRHHARRGLARDCGLLRAHQEDPSVARAMTDENALFAAKQQRNK
jgi:hypothetical protein